MATRIIRIATTKPTAVFGVAHPSDSIQRWLERSYQSMLALFLAHSLPLKIQILTLQLLQMVTSPLEPCGKELSPSLPEPGACGSSLLR